MIQLASANQGGNWTVSFNNWFRGKTFTLTDYQMPGSSYLNINLTPHTHPDFNYHIEVHDPDFYFPTEKELTIPSAKVDLDAFVGSGVWANINTIYLEYLDRSGGEGGACVESEGYSFTSCVEVNPVISFISH